ncbi:adenine phosphoribosyltransferase [Candidatus Laterigemmans baculatus]|uniref:adenine phosphoribosyltransferase n=1 Tax=Candidatus Laterigemmans baculatus TaxID=2770505 RepID=UPI0013D9D232|nr:adenine phosphoribosyltransferase [Candidatus Laterigemmans baculatus]
MSVAPTPDLRHLIRDIPDFPTPGILFRDITPLLADSAGLRLACDAMAEPFLDAKVDVVAAAEARGFIFAAPVAMRLGAGFVPIRKPGKLPFDRHAFHYDLEYGSDSLELHIDGVRPGQRVLIVDDLLATGGTVEACCRLLENCDAKIVGCSFLIHLVTLGGHLRLSPYDVRSVIGFEDPDSETDLSIQNRQPGPSV